MEKLLLNTYVHSLWTLFVQNNTALGIDILNGSSSEKVMKDTITELWNANANANVLLGELPAATLQNLYELATSQSEEALAHVKSIL